MAIIIKDKEDVNPYPHPYPALAHILGKEQAEAVSTLFHYVRPQGDWILVRSHLDVLDQAFSQIEQHLQQKWDGHCWSKR